MIDFSEYVDIFRIFVFLTSWWEDRLIDFTEYILNFSTFRPRRGGESKWSILLKILFFRLFDLLLEGQTDRFYWIYWIFSTFRLFDLLLGVQIDWYYWIYWIFSTLRLFDLLVGGQNDRFYRIYWFFSTFRHFDLLVGGQTNRFYWIYCFFRLFDFSNS